MILIFLDLYFFLMRLNFIVMDNLIGTILIIGQIKIPWHILVDHQNQWSLMIWYGIVNGYFIGPYFFERNVDRDSYLELLRDRLPELLEDVDLATRQRMWLQQNAAPHFARIVHEYVTF